MEGNNQLPPAPCPQTQMEGLAGGIFVKVMSDEQTEILRKQIAAYAAICQQLEELHRTLSNNDDHLAGGGRMSNQYCTTLLGSSSKKLSRRQRWNPTSGQLHVLERVFDQEGIRTPNPQKVKEITAELVHHGQIAEPNVYNWFQNRRARLKKKQMFEEANIAESGGGEMVIESFDSKVPKSQNLQTDESVSTGMNGGFCPENALARTCIVPIHSFQGCPKPSKDFAEMTTNGRMSWEESRV